MFSSFFWMIVKKKLSKLRLDTPISTTRAPKQAASIQFMNVSGMPTASIVTSNPFPSVSAATPFANASGDSLSSLWSRPNVRQAYSSLSGATSQIVTSAPFALAATAASTPIVPAPTTSTFSPALTFARCTPW